MIVTLLVVIVANIDDTESEANCWRRIKEKTVTDYIIYMASFVLPNFIALLTILGYLFVYFKIKRKASASLCLYLPLTAVPFILYYLVLKIMTFFGEWDIINILEVPLVCQPLVHGIIFATIIRNISRGKRPTSSDLTIPEESSFHESMLPE